MCLCFHKKNKVLPVEEPIPILDLPELKLERRQSHSSIVTGSREYDLIMEFRKTISSSSNSFKSHVQPVSTLYHN